MRILAAGCSDATTRSTGGFTLLEMLVALVVVGIAMIGVALALRPDDARLLAAEAQRLALLLEQAREESLPGGATLAWRAGEAGYAFERREPAVNGARWIEVRTDGLFRRRGLPAGVDIVGTVVDGRMLPRGERLSLAAQGAQNIMIELAAGSVRMRVVGRGETFVVSPVAEE